MAVDWAEKEPVLGILVKGRYEHIRQGQILKGWKLISVNEAEVVFRQGETVIKNQIY